MAQVPLILSRRFSSSPAVNQLVKSPIAVFGIEGRYASALYSAASKEKQLEQVEKNMLEIQALVRKKGKFAEFLLDPGLNRNQKRDFFADALGKSSASKLTTNIIALMAENGRLKKLDRVIQSFNTIMSAHRGEVECEVVSAKALDGPLQQELEAALKAFVKQGQTIKIHKSVDPSILGGLIVSIGDKYVDMSTATKIKKYQTLISASV